MKRMNKSKCPFCMTDYAEEGRVENNDVINEIEKDLWRNIINGGHDF